MIIEQLMRKPLSIGDSWCILDSRWFEQWKTFVGYDTCAGASGDAGAHPGPIDNSLLLDDDFTLRMNLTCDNEYLLVPMEAWEKLVTWYGLAPDQSVISRIVVEKGLFVKRLEVEIHLLHLNLCKQSDMKNIMTAVFSHSDTVETLVVRMRCLFSISHDKAIRLWCQHAFNSYTSLDKWQSTLNDVSIYSGQLIVIEVQNDNGTWNIPTKTSAPPVVQNSRSNSSEYRGSQNFRNFGHGIGTKHNNSAVTNNRHTVKHHGSESGRHNGFVAKLVNHRPGLCGLINCGNSCFMNSAIQCLSNVPSLTQYFLDDEWVKELNAANPLGTQGKIASSYAELIKDIWSGHYSNLVPRDFKAKVGQCKAEFMGHQQQDSQEFMAFLLDGLHEDLNRIRNEPRIEQKDSDNRADDELAKETWTNYRKRNDSVIVDTFHGMLKSSLLCPECQKVSVKFDPFCNLSVPLIVKADRQMKVFFVPRDSNQKICQYQLTVPKSGTISNLICALSALTDIAPEKMVAVDLYNHRFRQVFTPDDSLYYIQESTDIVVYEFFGDGEAKDSRRISVYMVENGFPYEGNMNRSQTPELFGMPIIIEIPLKCYTDGTLYLAVLQQMSRFVDLSKITHDWWKSSSAHEKDFDGENSDDADDDDGEMSLNALGSRSVSKSTEDDNGIKKRQTVPLFSLHSIDYEGRPQRCEISNGGPIQLSKLSCLAALWHPEAKRLFFCDNGIESAEVDESVKMNGGSWSKELGLADCLDQFTTRERLEEGDLWRCQYCKKNQKPTKKFDIWQLPRVLIIHMKRFSYTRFSRNKLDTFVRFPIRGLDMQPFVINENQSVLYDLISVVNHYGLMGSGHYSAFAKNRSDRCWYEYNDDKVVPLNEASVVTRAGYILVYERRSDTVKESSPATTINEARYYGDSNDHSAMDTT